MRTHESSKRLHRGQVPGLGTHEIPTKKLKEHSIAAITQLRSGHALPNQYLHEYQQRADSACECETGVETIVHFLFICPRYRQHRRNLLKALKTLNLKLSNISLSKPQAFKSLTEYYNVTLRFKDHWVLENNHRGSQSTGPSTSQEVKHNTTSSNVTITLFYYYSHTLRQSGVLFPKSHGF